MSGNRTPDAYAELIEPTSLRLQRLLPGPIERVWAFLTESDQRRLWLASGSMQPEAGSSFELVWRNDELTDPPSPRPPGFSAEHRMRCEIIEFVPPHTLVFTWGEDSEVEFQLQPRGDQVMLTVIHRRAPDRDMLLKVSAGWHAHLDVLAARLRGEQPHPFWETWSRLHEEYAVRMPA